MVAERDNFLLIGDSPTNVNGVVKLLHDTKKFEFDYRHVTAPVDIEAALSERQWDIILYDSAMSNLSPPHIIQQIQRHQPQPLIVLSEAATLQDAVDMMRQGARGVVEMADHPRLVDMIRQELEQAAHDEHPGHPPPGCKPSGSLSTNPSKVY